MPRLSTLAPAGSACVTLWLVIASLQIATAAPLPAERGNAAVEGRHTGVGRDEVAGAAHAGVRSYGSGAERLETFGTPSAPTGSVLRELPAPVVTQSVAANGALKKISGMSTVGSVVTFGTSPDGLTAVYIADEETVGRFELYSTPVDGSAAPTNISAGLPFGTDAQGVSAFQISPDGTQVVFLADPNSVLGKDDIFSVPIVGSVLPPTQLNSGSERPVSSFGISPDGTIAAFFGDDSTFGTASVELYSATIGSASSARQISDVGAGNALGGVVAADFSLDHTTMIYAADSASPGVLQWFSVPIDASGPGSDIQLSNALGSVNQAGITPDSTVVIYLGDDNTPGVLEIFAVPLDGGDPALAGKGGGPLQLNPSMAGSGVIDMEISPNSRRVAYLAEQDTAGTIEVYSALIAQGGSGARLNTAMAGIQQATTVNISLDSTTVLYEADQDSPGTVEFFGAPITGNAVPTKLHGLMPPDNVGSFTGLGTPLVGRLAVYPVFSDTTDLYSVPFDASSPFAQLNNPSLPGDSVFNGFIPTTAGARLMAYGEGPAAGLVTDKVNAVSIRGDLLSEQINLTAAADAVGALLYAITSTEDYGVFLQDQDTVGRPELFSRELDSDGDGVINIDDNCRFWDNPNQDPVVFGLEVLAESKTLFVWRNPVEVRFVRGPLDMVDVLAVDSSGTLFDTTSFSAALTPPADTGWYYLFAPDCPGRSYQTSLGAEPARDNSGLP